MQTGPKTCAQVTKRKDGQAIASAKNRRASNKKATTLINISQPLLQFIANNQQQFVTLK